MHDPLHEAIEHIGLSTDQINILQKEHAESGLSLQKILIKLNFIEKEDLLKKLALFFNIPFVDLNFYDETFFEELNLKIEPFYGFVFFMDSKIIKIALDDAIHLNIKDHITKILRHQNYHQPIEWFYGNYAALSKQKNTRFQHTPLFNEKDSLYFQIEQAIHMKASDINIFPKRNTVEIFYRIHGHMLLQKTWHKEQYLLHINKLKILSHLDITQTRKPQSGHIEYTIHDRTIHLRVSFHQTLYGESIAIRILDFSKERKKLQTLGFANNHLEKLQKKLLQKSGLILFSGETGSGKTTSLYACLDFLSQQTSHIFTLEDPIECYLDYAKQSQVTSHFSYNDGIRSILRQDPDILLIGEIRDEETARMTFRAAMTGHLVLSTVHAKSAPMVLNRLKDLGISENLTQNFLSLIVFQQLHPQKHIACQGKGCPDCYYSGWQSRQLNTDLLEI